MKKKKKQLTVWLNLIYKKMKFKDIKKQVDYLEDRVINNFDKYFSQLVLLDFYEGGFEDRLEDSLFYEEYFSDYESTIIDLLFHIKEESNVESLDLKLRLIKMKRIIDTYLSKVINNESDVDNPNIKRKHNRNSNFLLNQNLDTEKLIEFVHKQLFTNKLIDISLNNFKSHFKNEWDSKIQWLGTELQLTNFITLLIENEYLDSETKRFKNKLIALHFTNKKGNSFNEKQLGSVFSDKKKFNVQ